MARNVMKSTSAVMIHPLIGRGFMKRTPYRKRLLAACPRRSALPDCRASSGTPRHDLPLRNHPDVRGRRSQTLRNQAEHPRQGARQASGDRRSDPPRDSRGLGHHHRKVRAPESTTVHTFPARVLLRKRRLRPSLIRMEVAAHRAPRRSSPAPLQQFSQPRRIRGRGFGHKSARVGEMHILQIPDPGEIQTRVVIVT